MHSAWDVNEIYTNLWQGSRPPPGNLVAAKGFKVLVLAAEEWQQADRYPGVKVILAPGDDDENPQCLQQSLPTWIDAAKQVAEHVKAADKVLVTCMAGLNRSGFISTYALHLLTGWSGPWCVDRIQRRRQYALCNRTFEKFLLENLQGTVKHPDEGPLVEIAEDK